MLPQFKDLIISWPSSCKKIDLVTFTVKIYKETYKRSIHGDLAYKFIVDFTNSKLKEPKYSTKVIETQLNLLFLDYKNNARKRVKITKALLIIKRSNKRRRTRSFRTEPHNKGRCTIFNNE